MSSEDEEARISGNDFRTLLKSTRFEAVDPAPGKNLDLPCYQYQKSKSLIHAFIVMLYIHVHREIQTWREEERAEKGGDCKVCDIWKFS